MHTQTAAKPSLSHISGGAHNLEMQTKTAKENSATSQKKISIHWRSSDAIFAAVCVMRNCRAHKVNSALWQNVKIPLKEKATIGAHRKRAQR
jgi:hypothetical protein